MDGLIGALTVSGLGGLEPLAALAARVGVGLMFAISGWHKLFVPARRNQLLKTLKRASIPCARLQAPAVAAVELTAGAALVAGLLTPLAALGLLVISLVATAVEARHRVDETRALNWLENFLYLPEVLYVLVLGWLVARGGGPASLDALLMRAL